MFYGLQGNYFNNELSNAKTGVNIGQGLKLGSDLLNIFGTNQQIDSINNYYTQINRGLQTFNGQLDLLNSQTQSTLQQIQAQKDIANTNVSINENKQLTKEIVNMQPNNLSLYFAMRDTENNAFNQRFINDAQASSSTLSALYQKSGQLESGQQEINSLFNANEQAKQSQQQLANQQTGNILNTGIDIAALALLI